MPNDIKQVLLNNSFLCNLYIIARYIKFIDYCRQIGFTGYTENHHIIPKSFGGSNNKDNLIKLSARHHYIAHLLLAKATNNQKMIKALHMMVYSTKGDVQRGYKITSKIYAYVREKHSEVVSTYSKNTVVARQLYTDEIRRIPIKLFEKYNGVLYSALAKGRIDSSETKIKKQIASKRPRKVQQGSRSRSLAATHYSYNTPLGYCDNWVDLLKLYPSFTKNTLTVINNHAKISKKFVSIHKDFFPYIGKTFEEYGITKLKKV